MEKMVLFTIFPILVSFFTACNPTVFTPVSTDSPTPAVLLTDITKTQVPTQLVDTPIPGSSPIPDKFLTARDEIARTFGFPVDQVILMSIEEVEWRDSCMGIDQPGMACMDFITPGYRVFFDTPQGKVEVHTNADVSSYRILATKSGINGQAWISPACPGPVRLDRECPDRPYPGYLWVLDENGSLIAELITDAEGHFFVNLPPGRYTITQTEGTSLPALPPQPVTVTAGQFTQIELVLDSGMR